MRKATLLLVLVAGIANAGPLPPGSSGVTPNPADLTGTTLIDTRMLTLVGTNALGQNRWTADLTATVRRQDVTGFLWFTYELSNRNTSLDALHRITTTDFAGFDLSFDSSNTLFVRADRNSSGSTVGFVDFGQLGQGLDPGFSSPMLVLRTNATDYQDGSTNVINGAIASGVTFAPLALVPEPGSFVMAALGVPLAVAFLRRRKK